MPSQRHPRDAEESASSTDSADPSSSSVKIAFYDTTSYFREYFTKVTESLTQSKHLPFKVSYRWIESRLSPETVDLSHGCPVICVFVSDKVDASIASQLHSQGVRMIALRAAGFNNIDLSACDEAGLTVARVPAYSPYAVAEMATTLILALNRKVHHAYARVRDYNFSLDRLVGFDMHGKTVGVLGTGKIGQCFIDIMVGFGCEVLCYDVVQAKALQGRPHVSYASMDDVFKRSDVLSLHLPLTPDTRHLVSERTLGLMKPTALLINTGRGELVNTPDLLTALRNGRLRGAGLDVYEEEGDYFYSDLSEIVVKDRDLLEVINQPNCLVTSHQAFLTEEALRAIAKTTLDNVREWVEGKRMGELKNSVNKKGGKKKEGGGEGKKEGEGKEGKAGGLKMHPTSAHHRSHGQPQLQHPALASELAGRLEANSAAVSRERGNIQFLSRM